MRLGRQSRVVVLGFYVEYSQSSIKNSRGPVFEDNPSFALHSTTTESTEAISEGYISPFFGRFLKNRLSRYMRTY
jgi:hypothetical protein